MMSETIAILSRKESSKQRWLSIIDWLLPAYMICSVPLFYLGLRYEFLFKASSILVTVHYKIWQ